MGSSLHGKLQVQQQRSPVISSSFNQAALVGMNRESFQFKHMAISGDANKEPMLQISH